MNTSEQLEALENLSRLYLAGMARGCKTVTHRHAKHPEAMGIYQKASDEWVRGMPSIVDPRNWTTTLSRIPGRIGPVFGRKAWQRSGDGSRRR